MDQLQSDFLVEAEELIERLADDVHALRSGYQDGRTRRELVGRIFRHAHTLKGSSAALEQTAIAELTHEFETLLDSVRSGRSAIDENVLDIFDETISTISQMLGAVANAQRPRVPGLLVERLRELERTSHSERTQPNASASTAPGLSEELIGMLSETEQHQLNEALSEGAGAFTIEIHLALSTFDEKFKELSSALSKCGDIISTRPGTDATEPNQISFRIIYATQISSSQLATMLEDSGPFKLAELVARAAKVETDGVELSNSVEGLEGVEGLSSDALTSSVRIELSELDVVIADTRALYKETMNVLARDHSTDDPSEKKNRAEGIRRNFDEIEKKLLGLRTIPFARTIARAIRAGATAARATGKEIDFEIEGGETRLEKTLSDSIADPLLHLLRNAVDHGVESPAERTSLGKSSRGSIRLEVLTEDGQMRFLIIDDGRGIDPSHVARAAIERGMIDANAEISQDESFRIIFEPGFSTAESISTLSGRGVGLDVVSRAVEQVGGKILVQSKVGVGTTFELVLPAARAGTT